MFDLNIKRLSPAHSSKAYCSFQQTHHAMLQINGKPKLRANTAITSQMSLHLNNGMNDDKQR